MTRQGTLDFNAPLARTTDPSSSHAAAARTAPKVSGQLAHILHLIRKYPGCTAGELAAKADADVDQVTICKRVKILEQRGLIGFGPERECRVRQNIARTHFPEAEHA